MTSVWRDLNAFVRHGGPPESVIVRAHRAINDSERCSWQAEDSVMGMGGCGTMVQGVVLPTPSDRDGFLFVSGSTSHSNAPRHLRIASAMPMLVVDMNKERQRHRLAQLHADARMDVVWTKLAVHCTSNDVPQLPILYPNDFCMCANTCSVVHATGALDVLANCNKLKHASFYGMGLLTVAACDNLD